MTPPKKPAPNLLPQREASHSTHLWTGCGFLAVVAISAGAFFSMHTHSSAPVAPSALTNNPTSAPATLHAAAQLSMLSPEEAPEALMGTSFTEQEKNHILAAVRRGRMRLVDMPVLDSAGVTGQTISVTTAGLTQSVVLTGQFQHLILPIAEAAQVTIAPLTIPHAPVLDIAAMTALGPEALPGMTALDQSIVLDVIVQ